MFKPGDRVQTHDGQVHEIDASGQLPASEVDRFKIRGFLRGALVDADGTEHLGDWHENVITEYGHQTIIRNFVGLAGSAVAQFWGIGSTTVAASSNFSTTTSITSEWGTQSNSSVNVAGGSRANVAANQSFSSIWTLTQSFQYASSQINSTCTLNALAQYGHQSIGSGTAMSLATFASSTKGSSQALNVTYNWSFST